jgi:hypothetical protein
MIAAVPAEPLGAGQQAGDEITGGEGAAGFGVGLRLIADAQLDRVHPERDGKLVHRALARVHARVLTWRAHPGRDGDVQGGKPVAGPAGRRRVHHPAGNRRLLSELLDARRLFPYVVRDRQQSAAGIHGQLDPLDGGRPVTGHGEEHLPGQRQLDIATGDRARGQASEDIVRVRPALGAEAATNVRRDHAHLPGLQAEQRRDRLPHLVHALRRVVQREVPGRGVPARDGGVRLHGVAVVGGRGVGRVHRHCRPCQGRGRIALLRVGREGRVDVLRGVQLRVVGTQHDVVLLLVVGDGDQFGRLTRGLRALGHDDRDELAAEAHLRRLQDP